MRWYFPTWNGDFRLEKIDDDTTNVVVVQPTESEREVLQLLEKLAVKKGWVDKGTKLWKQDRAYRDAKRSTNLKVPIADLAPLLVKSLKPGKATLTAIRMSDNRVEVVEGEELDEKALKKSLKTGKAAASVKRPTPCCPDCYVGAVGPATDCLLDFLDAEQHAMWAAHRSMIVYGGLSGHRYLLSHRHTVAAARAGKICWDIDDRARMHFHDNSVPPEEEVLAAKLILEHREPWLRNEATALESRKRFLNPFGDGSDGMADTAFTHELGAALRSLERALSEPGV